LRFPFAGIIDKEDLPCGPEVEDWMKLDVTTVFLCDIFLTQDSLLAEKLFNTYASSPLWVAQWSGHKYLYNGHHRAVKAAFRGELAVQARIYMLD